MSRLIFSKKFQTYTNENEKAGKSAGEAVNSSSIQGVACARLRARVEVDRACYVSQ